KCDNFCFSCHFACQLDGGFVCFCPAIAKKDIITRTVVYQQLSDVLLYRNMIEIRYVPVFLELLFNRFLYLWMPVPEIANPYARSEIKICFSVYVFYHCAGGL